MNTQKELTREEKIKNLFAEHGRKVFLNTSNQNEEFNADKGKLLMSLEKLISLEQRMALSKVIKEEYNIESKRKLKTLANSFIGCGGEAILSSPFKIIKLLGKQKFIGEEYQPGNTNTSTHLKKVQKQTEIRYAFYLVDFVLFCFKLNNNPNIIQQIGLKLKPEVLNIVKNFHQKFDEKNQDELIHEELILEFILELSKLEYGCGTHYNVDLFSYYSIGLMYNTSGIFYNKGSASKAICSFKYCLRIAILLKLKSVNFDKQTLQTITKRVEFSNRLDDTPFEHLSSLHSGINYTINDQIKKPCHVSNVDKEEISFEGVPMSFDILNEVLTSNINKAKSMLEKLLLGFKAPKLNLQTSSKGDCHLPFMSNFCFGKQIEENSFGDSTLSAHLVSSEIYRNSFFDNDGKLIEQVARNYIKNCKKLEIYLLAIMHIFFGCGSRATDYRTLTFMNGQTEIETRKVSIYNEKYIHCVMSNNKVSSLQGRCERYSNLLPRSICDNLFIKYWKFVRPLATKFCSMLEFNPRTIQRFKRSVNIMIFAFD